MADGLQDGDGIAVGPEAAEDFVGFGIRLGLDQVEQVAQAISLTLGLGQPPLQGCFAASVGGADVIVAIDLERAAAPADWLLAVALGRRSGRRFR